MAAQLFNWQFDRELKWHTLAIENTSAIVFVYKSAGGDYVVSAMRDGDACGGDIEYIPTLAKAKKFAEQAVVSGEWVHMTLGGDAAACEYCGGNDETPPDHCMDCARPV